MVLNVTTNDRLNGQLVNDSNTDVIPTSNGPLSIDGNGVLTLAPNTASGTYTIPYQICEVNPATGISVTPANCANSSATVVVSNSIIANDDGPLNLASSSTSQVVLNVLTNDTFNGDKATISTVKVTPVSSGPIAIDANGVVILAPNTPSGTYTITYEICELGASPKNCTQATTTVVVNNTIIASNDFPAAVPAGGSVASVIINDKLNGAQVVIGTTPGNITLSGITVPTGLTLNPDGTIKVNINTPSGTYNVVYEICEVGAIPAKCSQATSTVIVNNVITAVADAPVALVAGGTTSNIVLNDKLNGIPALIGMNPGNVTLTGITVPAGLTLNANGTITANANTPSGSYDVVYEICEVGSNPINCSRAVATITIVNVILAVNDSPMAITAGNSTPTVILNDRLNGAPVIVGTNPGNVTLSGITVPAGLTLNSDGTIKVDVNTPSGTYKVVYEICEVGSNPLSCSQATATITVNNAITAVNDAPVTLPSGSTTPSIVLNDKLNGAPVVIGTSPGSVTLSGISVPAGFTLNASGTITVNANTPSGTYTIVYEICEVGSNPISCSQANAIVIVNNAIVAVNDTPLPLISGGSTSSVIINDLLNGVQAIIGTNPGNVSLSAITVPAGLVLNADGTVTVNANTPSGTYNLVYEICEIGSSPKNCAQASVRVVVANTISAVNDIPVALAVGGSTPSVVINDKLNGAAVVIGSNPGNVTVSGIVVPAGLTLNADGTVTVNANTPSGTYNLVYEICEVGANPKNCSQATIRVIVSNSLTAVNDTPPALAVGGSTPSVLLNDRLNGSTVVLGNTLGNVTLTGITVPAGLTLNADGTVTVKANTPSGTYTVVYEICEVGANPKNCTQANAQIVVANVLAAVNDQPVSIIAGGSTSVITINDQLNGAVVVIGSNPGNVTLSGVTVPAGLTLNANGSITANANTPSGIYTVVYEICEVGSIPLNCKQATVQVIIANVITAVNDTPVILVAGGSTISVLANDQLNGGSVVVGTNPGNVTLTGISVPAGITLNADGTITVSVTTPSGTYNVVYEICEVGSNPKNCSQATAKVLVNNVIIAVNDSPAVVAAGGTIATVIVNDKLNGAPVVIGTNPGNVSLLGIAVPSGLLLNADGTISVNANTPSGTYTVVYEICEVGSNPKNCAQATVRVTVANVIIAVNDSPVVVVSGASTPSVVLNDKLNGATPIIGNNPGNITLTGISVPNGLTLNTDGTVTVAGNTPSGTYDLVYEICEVGANPKNCSQATVRVIVANSIIAVRETTNPVNGNTGGSTTPLTANDTLNGTAVVIGNQKGQVILTAVSLPPGFILNANGTVTVPAGTPAGNYTVTYTICEVGSSSNCSTISSTVVVTLTATIVANNNSVGPINGIKGGDLGINILNDDVLNGSAVNPSDVILTQITPGPLTINPNGTVILKPNTAAGTYVIEYTICEKANLSNCSRAFLTVIVQESPMIAIIKTAIFNDENGDGFAQAGETISYKFAITNTGNVPLSNVTVTDNLAGITLSGNAIALLQIGETNSSAYQAVYKINQNDINLGSVSNQAQARGTSVNGAVVTDLSDDSSALGDRPTVLSIQGCVIEVFNALAPNGSGDNKVFRIRGLECYSDNTVQIYNRWGILVFERSGYNNNDRAFRGVSEGRVTINQSEELPEGTYYYILKYKDNAGKAFEKAGYLYINR